MANENVEIVGATGDFEKDLAESRARILENDPNALNSERGVQNEEQARREAIEGGRNALVESPYSSGETFSVISNPQAGDGTPEPQEVEVESVDSVSVPKQVLNKSSRRSENSVLPQVDENKEDEKLPNPSV